MFRVEAEIPDDGRERAIADLWESGSSGIVETEAGLCAFFETDVPPPGLVEWLEHNGGIVSEEPDRDWEALARAQWQPIEVGSRWYLAPEWLDAAPPAGRWRLDMNPGLACGSGLHEATQLCLEALEETVEEGAAVLDVGVGAGLLTAAAALLGAGTAAACDIDFEAVQIARTRLESAPRALLFAGSAGAVRTAWASVVVVNISAAAVVEMAGELRRILRPDGALLASGFEVHEFAAVRDALEGVGLTPRRTRQKRGWVLLESSAQ